MKVAISKQNEENHLDKDDHYKISNIILYSFSSIDSMVDFISDDSVTYHLGLKSLSTATRSKNSLLRDP